MTALVLFTTPLAVVYLWGKFNELRARRAGSTRSFDKASEEAIRMVRENWR